MGPFDGHRWEGKSILDCVHAASRICREKERYHKMKHERKCEIIDNYISGNHSVVRKIIKRAHKLTILELIETATEMGIQRHIFINYLRILLES